MLNSLDLLIIVFLALSVVSLLALVLLWLVKKPIVRRICLFTLAALSLYLAVMGIYIGRFVFIGQTLAGIAAVALAIAAIAVEFVGKGEKAPLLSRSLMSGAVVLGFLSAFCL